MGGGEEEEEEEEGGGVVQNVGNPVSSPSLAVALMDLHLAGFPCTADLELKESERGRGRVREREGGLLYYFCSYFGCAYYCCFM